MDALTTDLIFRLLSSPDSLTNYDPNILPLSTKFLSHCHDTLTAPCSNTITSSELIAILVKYTVRLLLKTNLDTPQIPPLLLLALSSDTKTAGLRLAALRLSGSDFCKILVRVCKNKYYDFLRVILPLISTKSNDLPPPPLNLFIDGVVCEFFSNQSASSPVDPATSSLVLDAARVLLKADHEKLVGRRKTKDKKEKGKGKGKGKKRRIGNDSDNENADDTDDTDPTPTLFWNDDFFSLLSTIEISSSLIKFLHEGCFGSSNLRIDDQNPPTASLNEIKTLKNNVLGNAARASKSNLFPFIVSGFLSLTSSINVSVEKKLLKKRKTDAAEGATVEEHLGSVQFEFFEAFAALSLAMNDYEVSEQSEQSEQSGANALRELNTILNYTHQLYLFFSAQSLAAIIRTLDSYPPVSRIASADNNKYFINLLGFVVSDISNNSNNSNNSSNNNNNNNISPIIALIDTSPTLLDFSQDEDSFFPKLVELALASTPLLLKLIQTSHDLRDFDLFLGGLVQFLDKQDLVVEGGSSNPNPNPNSNPFTNDDVKSLLGVCTRLSILPTGVDAVLDIFETVSVSGRGGGAELFGVICRNLAIDVSNAERIKLKVNKIMVGVWQQQNDPPHRLVLSSHLIDLNERCNFFVNSIEAGGGMDVSILPKRALLVIGGDNNFDDERHSRHSRHARVALILHRLKQIRAILFLNNEEEEDLRKGGEVSERSERALRTTSTAKLTHSIHIRLAPSSLGAGLVENMLFPSHKRTRTVLLASCKYKLLGGFCLRGTNQGVPLLAFQRSGEGGG